MTEILNNNTPIKNKHTHIHTHNIALYLYDINDTNVVVFVV